MSTQPESALPERALRTLPERPDLRHLKDQAKELFNAGGAGNTQRSPVQGSCANTDSPVGRS